MAAAPKRPNTSARTRSKTSPKKRRKKASVGKTILMVLLLVFISISTVFLAYVGKYIYATYQQWRYGASGGDSISLTSYDTTPVGNRDKVGYYVFGLMGPDSATSDMEMLSIVCLDKKNKTANILQVPKFTYLGENGEFAVKHAAAVWANPKDIPWCEVCRKRVPAEEIVDGKHVKDGVLITKRAGSSTLDVVKIFNSQYGLPVDGYFLFEQQTLVKLVDLLDGIDIQLDSPMKVGSINYAAGVRTLDGEAVLQYVTTYEQSIQGDIGRMKRFQQVFVSLLQRLSAMSDKDLTSNVVAPLMNSSTPIRVTTETSNADIVELIRKLAEVPFENMTAYLLPGSTAKSGNTTYFSVNKKELVNLLNTSFNPYGEKITEGHLQITELSGGKAVSYTPQKLSAFVVKQSGSIPTTATSSTNP